MEEKRSLEEMLSSLEECVNRMESGELSLEQSFEAFKEGIELVKQCNESIDMVEKNKRIDLNDRETIAIGIVRKQPLKRSR